MVARAIIASLAFLAIASAASAQDAVIYVDVANRSHENLISTERSVDQSADRSADRPSNEFEGLVMQLQSTKEDALFLYTDFASRAGNDMKTFIKNMTGFANDVIGTLDAEAPANDSDECWLKFEYLMKKIEHDARRAAVYSGDKHHKFILGHMVVFRMHLNKSEDYLKRCVKVTKDCGLSCESTARVRRWRRLAMDEIHRVRDDMQFSRRSYRDLVSHARRKLNHLKKQAISKSRDAVTEYRYCIDRN